MTCKNELKQIWESNKYKTVRSFIKTLGKNIQDEISKNYADKENQKLYNYVNEIDEAPKCPTCKANDLKFIGPKDGYNVYCSVKCATNNQEYLENRQKKCEEKYGVKSYSQTDEYKNKFKSTMKERYGVEYAMQSNDLKKKYQSSLHKSHGVNVPLKSQAIQDKFKSTMKGRHGVEYAMQSNELKKKHQHSLFSSYGVNVPLQSHTVQMKFKSTMKERYGVEYAMQSNELKEKCRLSLFSSYGVMYPMQSAEVKGQRRIKMEAEGKWIPLSMLDEKTQYYRAVWNATMKQQLTVLNNFDKRGLAGREGAYHIDHMISIKYGFENGIAPEAIGNITNLTMLPWELNLEKGDSSLCFI